MKNMALATALASYDAVETDYVSALRAKGLVFAERGAADARIAELRTQLAERGAIRRNGGASIQVGWLSKACVECTGKNGSETFSTTLKCHRDCYFCFNHNLAGYDDFATGACPWESEMDGAAQAFGSDLAAMAVTGGEPLLNLDGTYALLERAQRMFPKAHKRMYSTGDLLTEEIAARLRDLGLDEIRFSIKQDDTPAQRENVLKNMALAKRYIPDVMVEMPIIPGTEDGMHEWMRRFDEIGISGMNLLEFCFPFHNWDEFAKRGFELRNPPFPVMYDYGYSGGLAVAGSEELALELMLWAMDEGLGFGMHYCSLENKHRSEMRQRNERGKRIGPPFEFDEEDFFLKAAKVFGPDVETARTLLGDLGFDDAEYDEDEDSLVFPPRFAQLLKGTGLTPALAFFVLENDNEGSYLTEVALKTIG